MKVATVKVVRKDAPGGFIVINKTDLKKTDKIYKEKPARKGGKDER